MRTTKGPASRARRKGLLKRAKGYSRSKNRRIKLASETVMRALRYARRDRRVHKRDMRSLWIVRIAAGAKASGLSYSRFIDGLNKAEIKLNRKMLALLACGDPEAFSALVGVAKEKVESEIAKLRDRTIGQLSQLKEPLEIQRLRAHVLGKKGELTDILKGMAGLSNAERPVIGKLANEAKMLLEQAFDLRLREIEERVLKNQLQAERVDVTLPGRRIPYGRQHPLTLTTEKILSIFTELGFEVALGPDVETDFYNFQALNIPKEHPARDMQDTFWLESELLLRTHTSPVQIRTMEKQKPPLRIVAPGAVYRRDSDVTHSPMFHQVEGLLVDQTVSFANLKGVLTLFLQRLFGSETGVRFRPSFFPFTEPSAEVDIQCCFCKGKGCRICKQTGWLEILGAGLVDPEVFKAVHYPEDTQGFAFGVGIERVAMLHYGIDDIRHFFRNDLRFLQQFGSKPS